jgi:hypothetical protein
MFDRDPPAWRIDAKWASGILLALVLAAAIPVFSFSQLSSRARAIPVLEAVLRLTLLPPGGDTAVQTFGEMEGLAAGGPLELLPGTGVSVDPGDLEGLSGGEAAAAVARELARRTVSEGADAVAESLSGSDIVEPYERTVAGAGRQVVRAALLSEMMPSGLDNGSRLANWRLQAQRNPGEPVQPIVGVFVTVPPGELQGLSARRIGERVVTRLADVLVDQGLPAARELVSNPNLLARLESAANGAAAPSLEELLSVVLLPREEFLDERLDRAREALRAQEAGETSSLALVGGDELAGMDGEQANELVLRRLAERAHEGGSAALADALAETEQVARVEQASGLIDTLSRRSRGGYLRLTWLLGVAAVLLLTALASLSRGWGKLANTGAALALAALGGVLLLTRLAGLFPRSDTVALPEGPAAAGTFGHLAQVLAFVTGSLPEEAFSLLVRNHLAVLAVGVAMVALSVLLRLARRWRPRRRSLI